MYIADFVNSLWEPLPLLKSGKGFEWGKVGEEQEEGREKKLKKIKKRIMFKVEVKAHLGKPLPHQREDLS